MLLMIKLDKPDIETIQIGNNIAIRSGMIQVVFTPEAAQEFIQDVRQILDATGRLALPSGTEPKVRTSIRALRHCDIDFKTSLSRIGGIDLPIRTRRCFAQYGIETVEELCLYPEDVLLTMNNFGETSLKLVVDALATIGRRLPDRPKRKISPQQEFDATPPADHKCQKCGKDIGGSLWGFCSPECIPEIEVPQPDYEPCLPHS